LLNDTQGQAGVKSWDYAFWQLLLLKASHLINSINDEKSGSGFDYELFSPEFSGKGRK
jgi:hypothetical protein